MQEFNMPFSDKIASISISFDVTNKKRNDFFRQSRRYKMLLHGGDFIRKSRPAHSQPGTLIDEINILAQPDEDEKISKVIAAANGLCGVLNSGQGNKSSVEFTAV